MEEDEISWGDPEDSRRRSILKTYGEASEDWRRNLYFSSNLDAGEIGNAMIAARIASAGAKHAPVSENWTGHRTEGRSGPEVLKAFMDTFNSTEGPAGLRCNPLRKWTSDLEPTSMWLARGDGAVYFSWGESYAEIHVVAQEGSALLKAAQTFADTYLEEKPPTGSVFMMSGGNPPRFVNVGRAGVKLERDNYDPEVLEVYDRIRADLKSPKPRGRLSILSGTPGCGKTFLIKAMLNEVDGVLFIVVPQNALLGLLDPLGIAALTELKSNPTHQGLPIVLILEDSDDALAPRQNGDASVLGALLNLGDGIVGNLLDVRMVATTNREQQEFDPAILRPGRLSTATEVKALSVEHANSRLLSLLDADAEAKPDEPKRPVVLFDKPVTIAEIYQRAYDVNWKSVSKKTRKVGFGT